MSTNLGGLFLVADLKKENADKDLLIAALKESNNTLRELHERHRRTIHFLRIVNSSQRQRLARAHNNDEEFKEFCADQTNIVIDIETNVVDPKGGLPKGEPSRFDGVLRQKDVSNSRD